MEKKSNIVLVIDVGNPACDGKLNDRDFLNGVSHTLLPIYELAQRCANLGITCVTPDTFLSKQNDFHGKRSLLVTHLINPRTDALIMAGAEPFLLMCHESPMIAARFYAFFRRLSGKFAYSLAFSGMKRQAHPRTVFIPTRFPISWDKTPLPTMAFEEKETLALIAANKSAPAWKSILIKMLYGADVRLIYPLRKQLVGALAKQDVIHLYGKGWDTDPNMDVQRVYKGMVPAGGKTDTLSRYKFTLCFENAIFPGYLTEKIFDALMAGSVPVYLGDPEVNKIIPENAFIDARKFSSPEELGRRLKEMSAAEHEAYIKAGQNFLNSPTFKEFEQAAFVDRVLNLVYLYERR